MTRETETTDKTDATADTLLLLNEAISLGRKYGMAGQHLGAMCSARDEIERLHAALASATSPLEVVRVAGDSLDAWKANIRKHPMYQRGDTVLAWVNESEAIMHQIAIRARA